MGNREWIVIGGTEHGGILVRTGMSLSSPLLTRRLCTGAVVIELQFSKGRLHYQLVEGQSEDMGPSEGWVSVRVGGKDLVRASGVHSPLGMENVRTRVSTRSLTRDARKSLQEDLLRVYASKAFQIELHKAWSVVSHSFDKIHVIHEFCVKKQQPIFDKYGLTNISSLQCLRGKACFNSDHNPDTHEAELSSWIMWLCNPAAQSLYPRGPPHATRSSTADDMCQITEGHLPCALLSSKVLAKAPLKIRFVSINVYGALSGDCLCSIEASMNDQIKHIKASIQKKQGTPQHQQQLLLGEEILIDTMIIWRVFECRLDDSSDSVEQGFLNVFLLRHDEEKSGLLAKLENGNLNLWDLSPELESDMDYALAALKRSPLALKFAPVSLRSNREFMMMAVQLRGHVMEYASGGLAQDRSLALKAVTSYGKSLRFLSSSLQQDREIVLAAVEQDGMALEHASAELQADRCIVLAAVENHGHALQFASTFQADPDVVMMALGQTTAALPFVNRELVVNDAFMVRLEKSGIDLDGSLLDQLLWVEPETASFLLESGKAVFLDARDRIAFQKSHINKSVSLPLDEIRYHQHMSWNERHADPGLEDVLGGRLVLDSRELALVVYSDNALPASRCAFLAHFLREHPDLLAHRVLRMAGGLNRWKANGLHVEGDTRQMFAGAPIESSRGFYSQ